MQFTLWTQMADVMSRFPKWFVFVFLLSVNSRADDAGFKIGMAQIQLGSAASSSKASIIYDSDGDNFNGWLVGLTAKVPFGSGTASVAAQADAISPNWMIGLTFGKEFQFSADKSRIMLNPEWGISQFIYYPDTVIEKSKFKYLYVVNADWFYYREPDTSSPMNFEIIGRFSKDWTASSPVGIVTPATGTMPAIVASSEIIYPPIESAGLTGRIFFWKELKMGSPWAVGPSVAAVFSGPKINNFDNIIMGRAEFWVYRFMTSIPIVNLRIGIAPYVNKYFVGANTDGRTLMPGVLFQIKMGDPIFTY